VPPVSPGYDAAGNLTFDPLSRIAGQAATASPTGVLSWGPGQEYDYDWENRLTAVRRDTNDVPLGDDPPGPIGPQPETAKVMEFRYDALGRRVETVEYVDAVTGQALDSEGTNPNPRLTRHIYSGLEMIQEYVCDGGYATCEAGPALVREFVHGDPDRYPEPIAMLSYWHELVGVPVGEPPAPPIPHLLNVYHFLHDALGSVIGVVDDAGDLVERTTYDPYGKPFIEKGGADANEGAGDFVASSEPTSGLPVSSVSNPFGFTGHRYDAAVGLYHTLFRSYNPILGRWLQRDPYQYVDALNLYASFRSAPLRFVDQFGASLIDTSQPPLDGPLPPDSAPQGDSVRIDWELRAALDEAFQRNLDTNKEHFGGIVIRDNEAVPGPIHEGERGEADTTPLRRMPGKIASFHTHTNNTFFSGGDLVALIRDSLFGERASFVEAGNCTYMVLVVDAEKAANCAAKGLKGLRALQELWRKKLRECIDRKQKDDFTSPCGPADDPRTCEKEAGCAIAKKCGLKFFGGCGANKDTLTPMPCP
jgi:RHS repeat-associated protein